MSERASTKGPWSAADKAAWFRGQQHSDHGKIAISAGPGGTIANVYGRENANLIAAAPDLLGALLLIKRFGELGCVSAGDIWGGTGGKKPSTKEVWQFPRHLLTEIDAALAKAEGRTNLADATPKNPLSEGRERS